MIQKLPNTSNQTYNKIIVYSIIKLLYFIPHTERLLKVIYFTKDSTKTKKNKII